MPTSTGVIACSVLLILNIAVFETSTLAHELYLFVLSLVYPLYQR